MKLVYIAGPYSGQFQESNIRAASDIAAMLWTKGIPCICPHLNSRNFDGFTTWSMFMKGYLNILSRCDVILMVPGWDKSAGAVEEHAEALRLGIPIAYNYRQLDIILANYEEAKKVSILFSAEIRKQGIRPEDLQIQMDAETGTVSYVDPFRQTEPTVLLSSEEVSVSPSSAEQFPSPFPQHPK